MAQASGSDLAVSSIGDSASRSKPTGKGKAPARPAKDKTLPPSKSARPRDSHSAPSSSSAVASSLVVLSGDDGPETEGWTPAHAANLSALKAQLATLAIERARTDEALAALQRQKAEQAARAEELEGQIAALSSGDKGKGKTKANGREDFRGEREWTRALKKTMADIFDIHGFRLVQEGYAYHILHVYIC